MAERYRVLPRRGQPFDEAAAERAAMTLDEVRDELNRRLDGVLMPLLHNERLHFMRVEAHSIMWERYEAERLRTVN